MTIIPIILIKLKFSFKNIADKITETAGYKEINIILEEEELFFNPAYNKTLADIEITVATTTNQILFKLFFKLLNPTIFNAIGIYKKYIIPTTTCIKNGEVVFATIRFKKVLMPHRSAQSAITKLDCISNQNYCMRMGLPISSNSRLNNAVFYNMIMSTTNAC